MSPLCTPLAAALGQRIQAKGPIRLDAFWAEAMTAPDHGYYMAGAPIGAGGDFTTAPEISQIFGEMIGLWLVEAWMQAGRPKPFALVELGPGRGQLMADALRAAGVAPEFLEAAELILVEASPAMRREQSARRLPLAPIWRPDWKAGLAAAADKPLFLVANEFLDALPIRQLQRVGDGWRERMVEFDAEDGFRFALGDAVEPPDRPSLDLAAAPEGGILEWGAERERLAAAVARHIADADGAALLIDYGHVGAKLGDSLQALRDGKPADPLAAPGAADITSHVDFESVVAAAERAGARAWGPVEQGAFLLRLGAEARAARLARDAAPADAEAVAQGLRRLVDPLRMGALFKALALLPAVYPPPAGYKA